MQLTLHNDHREFSWDKPTDTAELGIADFPFACHVLRSVFADHRIIATLGALEVIAAAGAEHRLDAVEQRLSEYVHDIGNSIQDCWMGAKHAIQNLATMENEPKSDCITGIFDGTVLCLASGPSKAQYLDRVRELQNDCVIVIADSMWKGCRAAGIDPHFVCVLERDPLLASLVPPDPTSRARLIVPAVAYPQTVAGWEGRRIWFWQPFSDLYRWISPHIEQVPTGRSAGTMAASVSRLLGAKRIYLIGHDMCRGDDGSSHSAHVDSLASTNHTAAAHRNEPLHRDMIVDGKRTCAFWNLVRGDLESLTMEYPDRFLRLGSAGLELPNVPRCAEIDVVEPQPFSIGTPLAIPSRSPVDIKAHIATDRKSWNKTAQDIAIWSRMGRPESIAMATKHLDPSAWAHKDTADLYRYVMGPLFRAASLRAYIRSKEPNAHGFAFRMILRTVPVILNMMESEL